jgi:hypothetical protein
MLVASRMLVEISHHDDALEMSVQHDERGLDPLCVRRAGTSACLPSSPGDRTQRDWALAASLARYPIAPAEPDALASSRLITTTASSSRAISSASARAASPAGSSSAASARTSIRSKR